MAPGTDHSAAEATLQAAIDKLGTEIRRIDPAYDGLIANINECLRTAAYVSPFGVMLFSDKVQDRVDRLNAQLRQVAEEIGRILDSSAPILSLIRRSRGWVEDVLPKLSGAVAIARDVRPNGLHAWGGEAGDAYREKRWGQEKALQGTTNVVKETGQWLVDVAALNTAFLVDVTQPVIELIESIIEAAIEIATVFGILEAIDTVADAVASALTAILEILKRATQHMVDSMSSLTEARIIYNNNDVFPGGSWPQAVNR
ncbi:hypothetical protein [Actinoplanes utahensis]|uniref:ESX-1 secretion-associated protein EspA/EspE-like domain-containing protein n=1 Tax=Actinoplanes utahensis TaxID=1869 RepID=A0A0A6UMR9_ACTUT|nr:hypothetical protein [Actinoplanes utahensis]KHD76716.1 hypothetical protein MB27_15635 [Actinoplanes utahensis]GIF33223.1 hypothetical protein Aut01nite_62090 [Actinoplanes utahensis]